MPAAFDAQHREEAPLLDFMRVFDAEPMARINWSRTGIQWLEARSLAAMLGWDDRQFCTYLGLPESCLASSDGTRLGPGESERVLGMSALIGHVAMMTIRNPHQFDPVQWVASWLSNPLGALGGGCPAEFLDTMTGQHLVASLLAQIESGAYA